MKSFQRWTGITILTGVIAGILIAGCTRDITVAPTTPPSYYYTATHTPTTTAVPTNTRTHTPSITLTTSPTPSPTPTPTRTPTPTPTRTWTPTPSPTTFLPTNTNTHTMTFTFTPTPTTASLVAGVGASSPSNSTQQPGASGLVVLQVQIVNNNTSSVPVTSLVVSASGTGNDLTGIASVRLVWDQDNDGIADVGELQLGTASYPSDNGSVTFGFYRVITGGTTVNYLVVYNFSPAATAGTYQAIIPAGGIGTSVGVTGLPVSGATITIVIPTATLTITLSPTGTLPPTGTSTRTPTRTPTTAVTNTHTPTRTSSATLTPTSSPTDAVTDTPTATATLTPCNASSLQTAYGFEAGLECWNAANANGTTVLNSYDISTGITHGGSGAFHASVSNGSVTAGSADVRLDYSPAADMTTASISAWVYVTADLVGSQVQIFVQSGGWVWESGGWTTFTSGNVGTWVQVTFTPTWSGGNAAQVERIGLQFYDIPLSVSGDIYVDDVQINFPGTPTSTPTVTNTPAPPVCQTAPLNPIYYNEQEPVGVGGDATGTNDTCATGENPGAVYAGSDVVITGSLSSSGGGGYDMTKDEDYYLLTVGSPGLYQINLDCYSNGADDNWLDIFIWSADGACTIVYHDQPYQPVNGVVATLYPGDTYYISIYAPLAAEPVSYRLTLVAPPVVDTPTPTDTPSETPVGAATDTPTETPVETDTPTEVPTDTPTTEAPTATPTETSGTACTPVVKASYTFDADTECWTTNGSIAGSGTQFDAAEGHNATGALMAVIPFSGSGDELIQLNFSASPVTIPDGSIITLWYKASGSGNAQLFNISGGGWANGSWLTLPTSWTQISWQMSITANPVNQVGLQILNSTVPVTVWIDDVTITSPPTPTPTVSANCSPLLNGIEAMNDNGVWGGPNSSKGLSTTNVTQGTYSMDVNIITGAGWNDNFLILNNFAPANWTNVAQLKMDVYVDPALLALCGWGAQLALRADSNAAGQYYQEITADSPALTAGMNHLTWNIDFSRGAIPAGSDLSSLRFILNNGGGTAGLGHIYVDNMTLVYSPCPPTPLYSWDFAIDNQSWTDHVNTGTEGTIDTGVVTTHLATGYAGGAGAVNVSVPFTAADQQEWIKLDLSPSISLTAGFTIQMYVWIDGTATSAWPGAQIFVESGASGFEHASWTNLAKDGWTLLTFTPPFTVGDPSDIRRIGVQVMTGGVQVPPATYGTANIKVDNVIIY